VIENGAQAPCRDDIEDAMSDTTRMASPAFPLPVFPGLTTDHVRALCASTARTVLVSTPDGRFHAVTSDQAWHGVFEQGWAVVITRADLLDAGLVPGVDGALRGPAVEVCAQAARLLSGRVG
jgi:hypothetical protein